MALFDDIDVKQRLEILSGIKTSLERELFDLLIRLGIDYDTYEFGQHSDWFSDTANFQKRRLVELETAINTIDQKVAKLTE